MAKKNTSFEAMLDFVVSLHRQRQALQFTPPQKEDLRFLLLTCVAVGVGSRLGHQLSSQSSLRSVANSIKLADGFMKGGRTILKLRSPMPANLASFVLEGAKALAKGASKGDKSACFKKIFKGLKASEGAFNLVRYSTVFNYGVADPMESLMRGYKLTKSAFNVFDCVHGVRGYVGIKEGMEGVGVVVKAMLLYKQTHGFFIQGFRVSQDMFELLRNHKNEEHSKETMQKRRARDRGILGLQSENPCELKVFQESGLEVLVW